MTATGEVLRQAREALSHTLHVIEQGMAEGLHVGTQLWASLAGR